MLFSFLPPHSTFSGTKYLVCEPAAEAVAAVAVFVLKLYECLCVGGCIDLQTALSPHTDDVVVFGRKPFKKLEGTVNETFIVAVPAVGKEHRNERVDENEADGVTRQQM